MSLWSGPEWTCGILVNTSFPPESDFLQTQSRPQLNLSDDSVEHLRRAVIAQILLACRGAFDGQEIWLHVSRAAGGDRHHRRAGGFAPAGSSGCARSGAPERLP